MRRVRDLGGTRVDEVGEGACQYPLAPNWSATASLTFGAPLRDSTLCEPEGEYVRGGKEEEIPSLANCAAGFRHSVLFLKNFPIFR
jgi:hypothetical protein